jgi:hypothetical protein
MICLTSTHQLHLLAISFALTVARAPRIEYASVSSVPGTRSVLADSDASKPLAGQGLARVESLASRVRGDDLTCPHLPTQQVAGNFARPHRNLELSVRHVLWCGHRNTMFDALDPARLPAHSAVLRPRTRAATPVDASSAGAWETSPLLSSAHPLGAAARAARRAAPPVIRLAPAPAPRVRLRRIGSIRDAKTFQVRSGGEVEWRNGRPNGRRAAGQLGGFERCAERSKPYAAGTGTGL